MDLTFKGRAKKLDDIDLPRLGHKLGVGEDEIHAFIDVETRGYGFDKLGRPLMLFEPHVFYRNLSGAKRDQAVKAGLAYKNWGAKPYPKDSYPRLRAAIAIDETAALKSASWGLGQVLNENYEAAGFLTPQAMVEAMMDDEELQLEAAVNFILANKLDDELRRHDWAGFARGYNGPGYAKNKYDVKLAEAFRKWSRIKDTPWTPLPSDAEVDRYVAQKAAKTVAGIPTAPETVIPVSPPSPPAATPATLEPNLGTSEGTPKGWLALLLSLFRPKGA